MGQVMNQTIQQRTDNYIGSIVVKDSANQALIKGLQEKLLNTKKEVDLLRSQV